MQWLGVRRGFLAFWGMGLLHLFGGRGFGDGIGLVDK